MRISTNQALICIGLAGTVPLPAAGGPAIGLAVSSGSFQLESSPVRGTATLFEGSRVGTGAAASRLKLDRGAVLTLAPASRARVFGERLVLEEGAAEVGSPTAYAVEARSLRVTPEATGALARVRLAEGHAVVVAAVAGEVGVSNASGVLVARLHAGEALSFEPQVAPPSRTRVSGCVLPDGGALTLLDETTNLSLELRGANLARYAGKRVEITGTTPEKAVSAQAGPRPVQVLKVQVLKGDCSKAAQARQEGRAGSADRSIPTRSPGPSVGGAAAGAAKTVAVIGGVAAAGTLGGMAAAGSFSDSGSTEPPAASR